MRVVGLDLSLTATGVAVLDLDGEHHLHTIGSRGTKGASLEERTARLMGLAHKIAGMCDGADLVMVEQPAFSRTTGHHHDRSGLWWLVVDRLAGECQAQIVEVTPSGLKKYATGKGNADKDSVLLAVARRFPHHDPRDNNQADALVLAAMGARHLGSPVDEMPLTHLAAMSAVRWPLDPTTEIPF